MKVSSLVRLFSFVALSSVALTAAASLDPVRLYVLDCGRIEFKDMSIFSDTGEYDGKSGKLVDTCYLVRHPQGTLLWDTGLGDKIADQKGGVDNNGIHLYVDVTLQQQLKSLDLSLQDITYLAFSHFHFDHTGNANLFPGATWIINSDELAGALAPKPTVAEDPSTLSAREHAKTQMIDGDYDVFGDGTVKILKAPGHTPGHQVLEVKLAKSGTVILGGDLYHTRENRKNHLVPSINTNRAETLASMDRIERLVQNTHARFIIQHSPEDVASLPKLPGYLE